jgi:sulfoxide reductase catalytic subunit YedY
VNERRTTLPTIRIPRPWELPERTATPESVYLDRRQILATLGFGTLALALPWSAGCADAPDQSAGAGATAQRALTDPALGSRLADRFPAPRNAAYELGGRPLTDEKVAAAYNNFYEFTTDKDRLWRLAQAYTLPPWTVEVGGLVAKPRTLDLEELFRRFPLEERLYRFRCVERWAMQVPWTGFPLRLLIDHLEPLGSARFVRFVSLLDKEGLPGQRNQPWYPWPYFEGLRLDEARHDLAFVVLGSYGHALPMQHGAPLRLALPWKYGYKGPKSIVRIEFTAEEPPTFWNDLQPKEYGFYSNVDPGKPHPRWSQAEETDIGTREVRATALYNGYSQVAALYTGRES